MRFTQRQPENPDMAVLAEEISVSPRIRRAIWAEHVQLMSLIFPALFVVSALLLLPLGWLAWKSLFGPEFTTEFYSRIWEDEAYWGSFRVTFEISFLVTFICIVVGYPICYVLAQLPSRLAILGLFL